MKMKRVHLWSVLLVVVGLFPWQTFPHPLQQKGRVAGERLLVPMTLVPDATTLGAVCLDGSPAAYHLHRGFGSGAHNWLLQFEGGGWCNDMPSCLERARTRRGSTRYMNKVEVFSGILSDDPSMNPGTFRCAKSSLQEQLFYDAIHKFRTMDFMPLSSFKSSHV